MLVWGIYIFPNINRIGLFVAKCGGSHLQFEDSEGTGKRWILGILRPVWSISEFQTAMVMLSESVSEGGVGQEIHSEFIMHCRSNIYTKEGTWLTLPGSL